MILLIPAPEWRDALLAGGECGAVPPTAWRGVAKSHMPAMSGFGHAPLFRDGDTGWRPGRGEWGPGAHGPTMTVISDVERALVLAWQGRPVPEGCDRAARVLAAREGLAVPGGVLWRQTWCGWTLDGWEDEREYVSDVLRDPDIPASAIRIPTSQAACPEALWPAFTLGAVCAARGLGTVVQEAHHAR